ncbi:MAG: TRAP transporter substrate-binding protein DctP [Spirochaetales bacterium]|nr:TRAP transporter substrate-binding protein DctP [Spirochaetales bacterium]
MKKICVFLAAFFLIAGSMSVFAEGQQEGSSSGAQKTIVLKYNDFNSSGIGLTDMTKGMLDEVETLTEGRVKITSYFNASLIKYPETFQGICNGVADISYYMIGGTPGVHQLNDVFSLPFLGFKDTEQALKVWTKMLDDYPELQAENEKYNVRALAIHPMLGYHLHMTDKICRTPAEMKGEKILAEGNNAFMFSDMGASAMNMGPQDWYTSLQRNVVNGHFTHFVVPMEFKTDELLKYHTMFGDGGAGYGSIVYLVNLDSWSKISPKDQEIITEVFRKINEEAVKLDIELQEKALAKLEADGGHTIVKLTPEEIELWKKAAQPTIDNWISKTEAAGLPGQKIYDAITTLAAE